MEQIVNVNFRLNKDTKESMEETCRELGLSMSAAFTIFAKTVVRQRKIPFEISLDVPNSATQEALAEYKEMKNSKDGYRRYSSFKEIMQEVAEESVEYNKIKAVQ